MFFPTLLTSQNALATGVLFFLAGLGWSLGCRVVGLVSTPRSK
jgi:hypothetical protein